MKLFYILIERILGHEGGYVNNPKDPGGETNWGISKRSYPHVDIKNLTREQAIEIYKNDYWNKINGDTFPAGVAFQLLDFAINSGPETAIRTLQRVVGVADDGIWGPISRAALAEIHPYTVLMLLNAERLEFMTKLNNWPNASKGWSRRIAQNLRFATSDLSGK